MTLKFTLFGAAHAGKSTIAGLMAWKADPEGSRRQIEKARAAIGSVFDEAQALAYLVDVSDDERRKLRDPGSEGSAKYKVSTSRRLHIVRTVLEPGSELGDFDVIDTPGGWQFERNQRTRGMFYSDVGVFVIEATVAVNPRFTEFSTESRSMYETFGALFTWAALRPDEPLVIAISKMDQVGFEKAQFEKAKAKISALLGGMSKPIFVPISINVRERSSINVFDADPDFEWHHQGTLVAAIGRAAKTRNASNAPIRSNFMIITKAIERRGLGTGFFGKAISGRFVVGQRVKVIPVRPRRGDEVSYVGVVRAIEHSGTGQLAKVLNEGDVGGLLFSFGSSNAVDCTHATVVVDETTVVASGRYVRVRMAKEKKNAPKWQHFLAHIELLWLGRFHHAQIFEIRERDGEIEIGAMLLSSTSIACPLTDDGERLAFDEVQIIAPNDPGRFFPARLVSVASVRGVRVKASDVDRLLEQTRRWPLIEHNDGVMPLDDVNLQAAMVILGAALEVPHWPGGTTDAFDVIDSERIEAPDRR